MQQEDGTNTLGSGPTSLQSMQECKITSGVTSRQGEALEQEAYVSVEGFDHDHIHLTNMTADIAVPVMSDDGLNLNEEY